MLRFFPIPYPDEILYSVFARYHIRSGNTSPKSTLRELFGNINVTASIDFPSNINSLIKNLSEFGNYTADDFIYNNTLYSLFTPFIPENRAKLILSSMKNVNGGNINTRIGIMASSIQNPTFLRFCPKCFEEDKKKYGEAYWHRVHQISGVLLCPKHNTFVLDSSAKWHNINKHEYIAADDDNCKTYMINTLYSEKEIYLLNSISENIQWILDTKLGSRDINWFYGKYINILINKGLASPAGRVYQNDLLNSFIEFYGDKMLNLMQSDINIDVDYNWLSAIVRKPRKVFHPLRHLLFINYLGITPKKFFIDDYLCKPFGDPPWPCLNKIANHYRQNIITNIVVSYDNKAKCPVGTFKCECGFVYSRKGPDKTEADRYKIGRIKEFGLVWKDQLLILNSKNLSFREISRQLNVDTNTVIKHISDDLGNRESEKVLNNIDNNNNSKKQINRSNWLKLMSENKDCTQSQLRRLDNSTYMWLYRYDKEWLNNNIPKKSRNNYVNNRVNWKERDLKVLNIVKAAIQEILNKPGKPERICISRIGKKTGLQALLEKHINKLPITKEYLINVSEDVEAFQTRRIKWAAMELNQEGKVLVKWLILRKAGIKQDCSINILNAVKDELKLFKDREKVK